jgi:protein gp37
MSDKTGIEWTDATWNPTTGCDRVSPGSSLDFDLAVAEAWTRLGTTAGSLTEDHTPMHKKAAGRVLDGRTWDEFPGGTS